jgi:hypothetical protein
MTRRVRGARLAAVQLLRLNDDDMVLQREKVFFGEGDIGQGRALARGNTSKGWINLGRNLGLPRERAAAEPCKNSLY